MDIVSPAIRSKMMGRIRGKDTKAELAVRKVAFHLGHRYRLNRRDLPGTPDLVFPSRRMAIFVHGCFWHRHKDCKYSYDPKSNFKFWEEKFRKNVERDNRVKGELECLGWRVVVIWECQTTDFDSLERMLKAYLNNEFGQETTDSAAKADPPGSRGAPSAA